MSSAKLEEIEVGILKAVAAGRVRELPQPEEDSGHTKWLLDEGFIKAMDNGLALTDKGRQALASEERSPS